MMEKYWTLDDIPWDRFDRTRVHSDMIAVIKAASLVERNASDYVRYLCNVFDDDADFQKIIRQWGEEEVQHGMALGRWAELADPSFDFEESFRLFRATYRIPVDAQVSIRGSRANEMVARCVVEIGTSSLYSALRDAADEPVLTAICANIAKDEVRHYNMFYKILQRYRGQDRYGLFGRAKVAYERINEIDDDELSLSYHCSNLAPAPYDRRRAGRAYARRVFCHYRRNHIDNAVKMTLRLIGINPNGRLSGLASRLAWQRLQQRIGALNAA